jgi:tetratricopeptide (TPR) repeat protein
VSAEKSMRKAQLLEPGNAGVLLRAGWIDAQLGRSKEALFLIERSIKLDPLQVYGHEYRAYLLLGLGRYAESEAAYRKVDELSPNREGNHTAIGTALLLAGKADEALREIERETNEPWRLSGLGLVNYTLGRPSDSDAALKELKRKYAAEAPVRIGEVYAWRGEDDLAFEWLDRAYLERNAYAYDIKMNPFFQRLQSDHRFTAFLHKMKLQEWPAQAIGATGK